MTTHKNLRRKLQASAKRRARRSSPSGNGSPGDGSPSDSASTLTRAQSNRDTPDVGAILIGVILEFAKGRKEVRDVVVISALRACAQGQTPSGELSQQLCDALNQVAEREAISARAFRDQLNGMLSLARQQDSQQADPFLQLLRLLSQ